MLGGFLVQVILFVLLALVLIISAVSLFIRPAKRTIRASLVDTASGHIIDISQSETSIGRSKTCDISIPDVSVSRFHAVLSKRKNDWIIFDTNSTYGVVVNGEKIEKKSFLKDGDTIFLGQTEYVFYSTAVTTQRKLVPKNERPENFRKRQNRNNYKQDNIGNRSGYSAGKSDYADGKTDYIGKKADYADRNVNYTDRKNKNHPNGSNRNFK